MLVWILAAGAAICLAYFLVIVFYSGIGTSFAAIWLVLTAFLAATAWGVRYYQKYSEKSMLWLPVSLVTLCVSGLVVLFIIQILMFGQIPASAEPNLDYVVVLGAGIREDRVSSTLKLRLDKAVEYIQENPDTVLILSGGQGKGEARTEASAMEEYLLLKGVPAAQMILEEQSVNTKENFLFSKRLIEKDQEENGKRTGKNRPEFSVPALDFEESQLRIGVLTSNFHLYRARKIAQKQGETDLSSIAAPSDRVLFLHFCLRDAFAILKDRLVGNL